MKQAFYPRHKQTIARAWTLENTFLQAFRSVSGCQTCMCKRGKSFDSLILHLQIPILILRIYC